MPWTRNASTIRPRPYTDDGCRLCGCLRFHIEACVRGIVKQICEGCGYIHWRLTT